MKQFVYKHDLTNLPTLQSRDDVSFVLINNISKTLKHSLLLLKRYHISITFLKIITKLLLNRNPLYIVIYNNYIVSDGLLSLGACNYYTITKRDCVIGPVYTDSKLRGRGLATYGLLKCLHYLNDNYNIDNAYIDTSEDNIAMQSVIKKLMFSHCDKGYERSY